MNDKMLTLKFQIYNQLTPVPRDIIWDIYVLSYLWSTRTGFNAKYKETAHRESLSNPSCYLSFLNPFLELQDSVKSYGNMLLVRA